MTSEERQAYINRLRQRHRHDATTFSRVAIKDYLRLMAEIRPEYRSAFDFAADLFDKIDEGPANGD